MAGCLASCASPTNRLRRRPINTWWRNPSRSGMTPWLVRPSGMRPHQAEVPGGPMSWQYLAEGPPLTGGDRGVVVVVAVIALAALAVGYVLLKEVLAAGQGTSKMQDIAKAVQEGANAYLKRQRNTLLIFGIVVFALLFALPADGAGELIGRSVFFVIGAVFSFSIGYLGM